MIGDFYVFKEDTEMKRNNDGIVRLVRELVEQLESYYENVMEPMAEHQPHNIGDDRYEIAMSCRKAKKLLAIHDREVDFEDECDKAFKSLARYKMKMYLDRGHSNKLSKGVTEEELSELLQITSNLTNLLRKALFSWKSLRDN